MITQYSGQWLSSWEGRKEFNVGFEKMIMFYFLTRWWMVIVLLFFKLIVVCYYLNKKKRLVCALKSVASMKEQGLTMDMYYLPK